MSRNGDLIVGGSFDVTVTGICTLAAPQSLRAIRMSSAWARSLPSGRLPPRQRQPRAGKRYVNRVTVRRARVIRRRASAGLHEIVGHAEVPGHYLARFDDAPGEQRCASLNAAADRHVDRIGFGAPPHRHRGRVGCPIADMARIQRQ